VTVGLAVGHSRPQRQRLFQACLQGLHLGHSFAGFGDTPLDDLSDHWARRLAAIGHAEDLGNFVQMEAEPPGAQNKAQASDVGILETTVAVIGVDG